MKISETWSGRRNFPVSGFYFELLTADPAVDVELIGVNGDVIERVAAVTSGFFCDRRGTSKYTAIAITTAGAQTVAFLATDGFSGNRSVPADVSDRAARLIGIVYGALGQLAQKALGLGNALLVTGAGESYGASVASSAATGGAGAVVLAVFTAAQNTNGATLYTAARAVVAGAAVQQSLLAKSSAPTSATDGDGLAVQNAVGGECKLFRPVYIPAGKGVYFWTSGSETSGMGQATYTLH